jgi:hypothetical protein
MNDVCLGGLHNELVLIVVYSLEERNQSKTIFNLLLVNRHLASLLKNEI